MKKLYLDDVRIPKTKDWIIVRSYDEFVNWISENGLPDVISFDHDLAHEHYSDQMYYGAESYNKLYDEFREKTGYDAAKWVCEYCLTNGLPIPEWNVHSANPVGSENIKSILTSYSLKLNN